MSWWWWALIVGVILVLGIASIDTLQGWLGKIFTRGGQG